MSKIKFFVVNVYYWTQVCFILFYWLVLTALTFIGKFRDYYIDFFFSLYRGLIEIFGENEFFIKIFNFFSIFELFFIFFFFSFIVLSVKFFYFVGMLATIQWCSMFLVIFDFVQTWIPEVIFELLWVIYIYKYVKMYVRLVLDIRLFKAYFFYLNEFLNSLIIDFQFFYFNEVVDLSKSEYYFNDLFYYIFIFFLKSIVFFCDFFLEFFYYFWLFLQFYCF